MNQRTYRANGYSALAKAFGSWQQLPISELIARVGLPLESSMTSIDGEEIAVDVWITWVNSKQDALRIHGVAHGTNHLQIERVEESVIVNL